METTDELPAEKMDVAEQPSDNLPENTLPAEVTDSTNEKEAVAEENLAEAKDVVKSKSDEKTDQAEIIEVLTEDEEHDDKESAVPKDEEIKPAEVEKQQAEPESGTATELPTETAPNGDRPPDSEKPVEVPDVDTDNSEVAMEVEPSLPTQDEPPELSVAPQSPRVIELLDDDDDDMAGDKTEAQLPTTSTTEKKDCPKVEEAPESIPHESESSVLVTLLASKPQMKTEPEVEKMVSSSSDDEESIYYDKECVNYECGRGSKKFYKAPLFVLNFYKIQRKTNKVQFVCNDCYNAAVVKYGILATALESKKPLLEQDIPKRQDYVEILDSSDEDDGSAGGKCRVEKEIDAETLDMLQEELDSTICEIFNRVEIHNQVNWSKNILMDRLKRAEVECQEITESLKMLQKNADKMHTQLYQCPKIKIKELQALDLNTGRPYAHDCDFMIPPVGELKLPPIDTKSTYYAVRNKAIASWLPCQMVEAIDVAISGQKLVKYYKVKYHMLKVPTVKCVSSKHMAYGDAPSVRLSVGTRVIALFDGTTLSRNNREIIAPNAFYPGIIAEQLQVYNKYRYLIFFDDGYAQYVHHKDVRVVCYASENVWDDVHPTSREFIHNYLSQYQKHRPMVQVKKGQSMITESNGKWLYAKVIDVDASLVQMQFEGQNRYEWIYRGSTRLGPLFKEKQANGAAAAPQNSIVRRTEPYVRYDEDTTRNDADKQQAAAVEKQATRAVAKKSTSRQESQNTSSQSSNSVAPVVKHLNNEIIFLEDDARPKGKVVYYTAKKNLPPKLYSPHQCNPGCLFTITHNLHSYSPLAKPLLSGWERQIFKSKLKKSVVYRAPCGRRIRNMEELHRYLRLTNNTLNVDNFDFDCAIHCLAEYVIESSIVTKPDLSNGLENMVIPCINYYDNSMPPYCEYSVERIPTEGVRMNLDPSFLCGCDCEDDCMDKSKCSCWQLTLAGARFGNPNTPSENIGYAFKRLLEPVPTGIYECNVNCKCSKSCVNRVVQHALQVKLQVFKTSNRGWGLRCLNDIPKGTFICIYAGHLLTEQKANEGGLNASDEYFAELDYIEVVERLKEGYESDVDEEMENDEDLDETVADADSDEEFRSKCQVEKKDASINTRLRTRRSTIEDDKGKKNGDGAEDSQERRVINFDPVTSLGNEEQTQPSTKYKSIRKYFGKNEFCYIMDAKKTGNIGRYFNHCCAPNLFVQNVFVDTQDLRFPWVAFFALTHIRAGTELTWNYNYEVGIVPGKVLYCECGAPNCRGRLL